MTQKRLIILGSGPAGWTAALYASRAGLNPMVITGLEKGGQLMTTTDVDNWPGDVDGILGPALMDRLENHAVKFGTQVIHDHIIKVDIMNKPFKLIGELSTYECDALIIATGASAQYLGLESESKYLGKGVSGCATCDGFFYRNQEVAVVGGGNTAIEEALYLSNIANKVHLIHRRDSFRAEKIMLNKLYEEVNKEKIILHLSKKIDEVLGDSSGVTGVRLYDIKENSFNNIALHGVFIAIGHKPNTNLFKGQLNMNDIGYLYTNKTSKLQTSTSIAGVFAAGDVADDIYRQAITSASSGCQAALDVVKYFEY